MYITFARKLFQYSMHSWRWLLSLGVLLVLAGCTYPRDPERTMQNILVRDVMLVGLSEGAPWVIRQGDEPAGVEVELVRKFAREIDVDVQWHWAPQDELMQALHHYELDLVIGGLSSASPWQREVGITGPYFVDSFNVGVPHSLPLLQSIEQVEIAVERGSSLAAHVEAEGGVPVPVDDLAAVDTMPVAAPVWKLEALGFMPTQIVLYEEQHVIAVPPGENRWLLRLEQFLQQPHPIELLAQQLEVASRGER